MILITIELMSKHVQSIVESLKTGVWSSDYKLYPYKMYVYSSIYYTVPTLIADV